MPIRFPRNRNQLTPLMSDTYQSSAELEAASFSKPQLRKKERRSVRFYPEVYVQETEHVNDMSDEEVFGTWFQPDEFKMIKKRYAVTVRMMMTGRDFKDHKDHCSRGLEYRTRDGSRARQLNKLAGLASVLDEQERQRVQGEQDDEAISREYYRVAEHCRVAAFQMGLKDEAEVYK